MEILFVVLFAHLRRLRSERLKKAADLLASKAGDVAASAKQSMPAITK